MSRSSEINHNQSDLENQSGEISFESKEFNDEGASNYLFSLLDNTVYDQRKRLRYEIEILDGLTSEKFDRLKNLFYQDRIDPITMNGNYNMTELKNHLKKLQ